MLIDLEFPRKALMVSDAATGGCSSPRLCLNRACPGMRFPVTGGCCTNIHIPFVVLVLAGCMLN